MTLASLITASFAAIGVGHPSPVSAEDPPPVVSNTSLQVDEPELRGDQAVDAMAAAGVTDAVAADVDLTPTELVTELRDDDSMFVTDTGRVGFVDVGPSVVEQSELAEIPLSDAELRPSSSTGFDMNSKPGAPRVIYLDFTGHTTTGDHWNATYTNGAPIVSAPYDTDGNPAAFSPSERDAIYQIWQRVAEDYLPFDVNVTTVDPGVEGLRRTSGSDAYYGQRMVISPTDWYGQSGVIGLALLSVYDAGIDHPAFVFATPRYINPRVLAEAISHEAGHTFGLRHDGIGGSPYYDGHAGWAPIMGRSVNASISQWSNGEYPSATNTENDIAMIGSYVGYRADDVGNSNANATLVSCVSTTQGVIGARGDRDVFAVDVGAGRLAVTARPLAAWANLHASVTVRNSSGGVVASGQPGSLTSWTSNTTSTVAAGRYYIEVVPTSWRTPANGFTVYGSMGAYQLSVAGVSPTGAACTARLSPITPNRLLDTRNAIGGYTRLRGGQQAVVQVTGTSGIPAGATAAVVNVTAVGPSAQGYVTVYPCTDSLPDASNVNYVAGQIVSNSTIAALSPSGQLCVWTYADSDVLVDVTGWLGVGGATKMTQVGPARVVDTRQSIGGARIGAGATMQVDFTGRVPAGTTAVSFNITAVGASGPAFMTAYPCGRSRPETSVVNYWSGEARPNNVIVGLGAGKVCIYSYAASDVIVDLTGHFSPSGALSYQPTPPIRVLDTRSGAVTPPVPAGSSLTYGVARGGLGALDPDAAFVNVTAVDHPRNGYVTTYDCGTIRVTSTVNQVVGQANANGAIVPLNSASQSCAWMSDPGHLIVDLNGWWVR